MSIFNKVRNIADAFLHPLPIGEEWYEERLKICSSCELNSDNCDDKKLTLFQELRKNVIDICPEKRFCTACGCCIDRKAAVKVEECGAVELKQQPKWHALEIEDKNNKGFIVENLSSDSVHLSRKNGLYILDFGYVEKGQVLALIGIEYFKDAKLVNIIPSCGCTVVNIEHSSESYLKLPIRVSTLNFKSERMTEKSLTVSFIQGSLHKILNFKLRFYMR